MKDDKQMLYPTTVDEPLILCIRNQKVILDADLARVYGVPTKVLNQAVKRNADRFPPDFLFQVTVAEIDGGMRSQIVTASGKRNVRFLPFAFTEHGAIMAATVLNSPRAVQMSVFVVRAFIKMRAVLTDTHALARQLTLLEKEVKARLDSHDAAIVDVLQRIMDIIDPPPQPDPPAKAIGFSVREARAQSRVGRKS